MGQNPTPRGGAGPSRCLRMGHSAFPGGGSHPSLKAEAVATSSTHNDDIHLVWALGNSATAAVTGQSHRGRPEIPSAVPSPQPSCPRITAIGKGASTRESLSSLPPERGPSHKTQLARAGFLLGKQLHSRLWARGSHWGQARGHPLPIKPPDPQLEDAQLEDGWFLQTRLVV